VVSILGALIRIFGPGSSLISKSTELYHESGHLWCGKRSLFACTGVGRPRSFSHSLELSERMGFFATPPVFLVVWYASELISQMAIISSGSEIQE
jgi:hypothetical protein